MNKPIMRQSKDEEKIKQFKEQKMNYYKNLGKNVGTFKTTDRTDPSQRQGGVNAFTMKGKRVSTSSQPDEIVKKSEDLLMELTSAAQSFIPYLQQHSDDAKQ